MSLSLLFHTIRHLKPVQLWYQIKYKIIKVKYRPLEAPNLTLKGLDVVFVSRKQCLDGRVFSFLNREHIFAGWGFNEFGSLWTYNQNYFDWLNQEGAGENGVQWIDQFIDEVLDNQEEVGMSLDSYPTALRSINWIKFFCRYPGFATKRRLDSLYSQLILLEKKLEYHLLGNHLLEDAYALYFGASFFSDRSLLKKSEHLLLSQLREQILPDGAHFEQSPMYHCILLDRLLDCINIRRTDELEHYAKLMLGHLESILWADGSFTLLNDAVLGIAPEPSEIFDYARRLGLTWEEIPLGDCGFRRLVDGGMEAIVDVGNVTAAYQPGHTHADVLSYELRIDGKPVVVDTGVSTYEKNTRRQLERSTIAHNCVSVDGKDSYEVWGGFRVGRRANVEISISNGNEVEATHDGFAKPCRRRFLMEDGCFTVEDWYDGEAVSYVHLASGVDASRVRVKGALSIEEKPWKYATEYNQFHEGIVFVIRFSNYLKYSIR